MNLMSEYLTLSFTFWTLKVGLRGFIDFGLSTASYNDLRINHLNMPMIPMKGVSSYLSSSKLLRSKESRPPLTFRLTISHSVHSGAIIRVALYIHTSSQKKSLIGKLRHLGVLEIP